MQYMFTLHRAYMHIKNKIIAIYVLL